MLIPVLLMVAGFGLLIVGADWLVKGASSSARRLRVPEIVIGLTVVAMGTATPELIINIIASLKGSGDISLGNAVGSNNYNMLILGISAIIYPLTVRKSTSEIDIPFAFAIGVLLLFMVNDHWLRQRAQDYLGRIDGSILLVLFAAFLIFTLTSAKKNKLEPADIKLLPVWLTIMAIVGGLTGLVAGGELVVKNAIFLAKQLGISQKIIGLTVVSAGTALPELATSVTAAYHKQTDLAVGNIIGSYIFNLLMILGVSAVIHPIAYSPAFNVDVYMMLFSIAQLFLLVYLPRKQCVERWHGGVLVLSYVVYGVFFLW